MSPRTIAYRRGYKYQLAEDYSIRTGARPEARAHLGPIVLEQDGLLHIAEGYAWDGPSGPTFDTRNFMRGSLVHDALYQLLQHDLLPPDQKDAADRELQQLCLADGMCRLRALWVYWAVRLFGRAATRASARNAVLYAP